MDLYDYQKKVAQLIRQGKNVIIQAPTGSGKTRAALYPYLEVWDREQSDLFPRRCIYSVPMRILAKQFHLEYLEIAKRLGVKRRMTPKVQTGDRPDDRQFEGDLIFCTIDQSLSSLLGVPYALSRSKSNLNAGAIIGAYLVFDEYHLFPTTYSSGSGALGATLEMLRLLKGLTPFCLMTATFSEKMLKELAQLLEAEVVTVGETELKKIETDRETKQRKERCFHVIDAPLSAPAVLEQSGAAQRIIVVCNRVDRAQSLYQELEKVLGRERVILLHSRFLRKDRDKLENDALREFGKDQSQHTPGLFVLVATQVVEVGLDLSCEVMHTEVAPANAVIQRAGRCARRPGDKGQVFIYDVPPDSQQPYLPYNEQLCRETLVAFANYNGQVIRFPEEQAIINRVHNEADQKLLDSLRRREYETLTAIENTAMLGETSERAELIRLVDNRTLLVHDVPKTLGDPLACEGFSLFRWTLKGRWEMLQSWAEQKGLDYALYYPHEGESYDMGQATPEYLWKPVTDASLLDLPLPFVIHPKLVAYDDRLGFRFDENGTDFRTEAAPEKTKQARGEFTYQLESYDEHIGEMMKIYRRDLQEHLAYTARRFETLLDLKPGAVDRAARLVIALHDAGKFNETWQAWAHTYHRAIDAPLPDDFMVAHTLSQTDEHRAAAKRTRPKRPHHAGEGAAASVKMLATAAKAWARSRTGAQVLLKAMLTAITRHHNARTESFEPYQIHPAAQQALQKALSIADLADVPVTLQSYKPVKLHERLVRLEDEWPDWFLYFTLVRPLILADHKSLAEKR